MAMPPALRKAIEKKKAAGRKGGKTRPKRQKAPSKAAARKGGRTRPKQRKKR